MLLESITLVFLVVLALTKSDSRSTVILYTSSLVPPMVSSLAKNVFPPSVLDTVGVYLRHAWARATDPSRPASGQNRLMLFLHLVSLFVYLGLLRYLPSTFSLQKKLRCSGLAVVFVGCVPIVLSKVWSGARPEPRDFFRYLVFPLLVAPTMTTSLVTVNAEQGLKSWGKTFADTSVLLMECMFGLLFVFEGEHGLMFYAFVIMNCFGSVFVFLSCSPLRALLRFIDSLDARLMAPACGRSVFDLQLHIGTRLATGSIELTVATAAFRGVSGDAFSKMGRTEIRNALKDFARALGHDINPTEVARLLA